MATLCCAGAAGLVGDWTGCALVRSLPAPLPSDLPSEDAHAVTRLQLVPATEGFAWLLRAEDSRIATSANGAGTRRQAMVARW